MSRNTKAVLKGFRYEHADDFAAYLSDMASKGWHFKEWGAGLIFEKGEPEQAEYAVEVFINGTEYDTRPEPYTLEFAEYCEAAGWKLIDAKRKFCIFKKISTDAVPILTPEERLENTVKATRGNLWYRVFISASWTVLQLIKLFGTSFINRIFSNTMLLLTATWVILLIASVVDVIRFYWWKHRSSVKLRDGKSIYFGKRNGRYSTVRDGYTWISSILFSLLIISFALSGRTDLIIAYVVIFGATILLSYFIAKFRPESDTNQMIQIIFAVVLVIGFMFSAVIMIVRDDEQNLSTEHVPVTYEDLGIDAGTLEDVTVDSSGSFFGYASRYWLEYENESVSYQVYETQPHYQWILDHIWAEYLDGKYNEDKTECTQEWMANLAYRNKLGTYYVRYPDAIIIWNGASEIYLTQEQIQMIYESLYTR